MKRWHVKSLEELGELRGGGTPSRKVPEYFQGETPWITGADVTDFYITKARNFITREAIENSATTLLPKDSVLVVSRTGVGKIGIAGMPLCISQDLTGVICNREVRPTYLARFLLANTSLLTRAVQGATILGITRDFLKQIKIPVPPLVEQDRIILLLDEAHALRKLRAQAHARTAQIVPALFQEMFGDPVKLTESRFPVVKLEDIALVERGRF
jgi:type I restriction enzyme S subunit